MSGVTQVIGGACHRGLGHFHLGAESTTRAASKHRHHWATVPMSCLKRGTQVYLLFL